MVRLLFFFVIFIMHVYTAVAQTRTDSIVRILETNAHVAIASLNKIISDKSVEATKPMVNSLEQIVQCLSECSETDTAVFSSFKEYYGFVEDNCLIINEDRVVEHSLHYFVAAISECKFLIDYRMNKDSWKRHLFESIDHYNTIDTVIAKQKINNYRKMICNDYGTKSLEYFLSTDILLSITQQDDVTLYERVRKEYLKLGKSWKNDKRYSDFLASYIPHVIRLLPLVLNLLGNEIKDDVQAGDLVETGVERYDRISGKQKKLPIRKNTESYEQLKDNESKLCINAEIEEEKGNYGKASQIMQQAIACQLAIIKGVSVKSTKTNIEIREIKRLVSLLNRIQTKDGVENSYVNSSIDVLDELFSFNDTIAIHTAVQFANDWENKYQAGDVFANYLRKRADAKAFTQNTRIYERACLLRAEAIVLSVSKNKLKDACSILQMASQIVYNVEGFSNHYFDIKTSEILFYIYKGQSIGMSYIDIVHSAEQFLEELKYLPDYKDYYEYIEVKSALIRSKSKENKDWRRIKSYAEELVEYIEDENSTEGEHIFKYKTCVDGHFYSILYCYSLFMPTCFWNQQYSMAELCLMAYRNLNDCCIKQKIAKLYLLRGHETIVNMIQKGNYNDEVIEDKLYNASFIAANTDGEECANLSFNNILLCKGLQLYSYHILEKINQLGVNKELASLIDRYAKLMKKVEFSSLHNNSDIKEIKAELSNVTYDLFSKASEIDYYANYFKTNTEDIFKCLKQEELAIEFSTYQSFTDSTTFIVAHVLNGSTHSVKTMQICKKNTLQVLLEHTDCTLLYDIIWRKILSQYKGTKKVYFSPVDILHSLPIENGLNGKCFSYRVSSLRQLLTKKKPCHQKRAVLFGGLIFDSDTCDINTERGAYNSLYLPSTLTEIEKIQGIIESNGWKTMVFKGETGTEKSMANIDYNSIGILHIATHGYFVHSDIKGDLSLCNSGLLLSNCRHNIAPISIEPIEDGVLTALEVSEMDLRSLDHVTLSACETGLGEFSGEGVFGLQRGFKKAGVNSILMSLWKVDDEATCKLMTEFYSNWIAKKMTKHDALEAAKKVVRETKGWEDPKYWAAFILLDGLD